MKGARIQVEADNLVYVLRTEETWKNVAGHRKSYHKIAVLLVDRASLSARGAPSV